MEGAPPVCPPQHLQRLALEGVVLTDDGYAFGIAIEVVVGSVSSVPLTAWTTECCGSFSTDGCVMACCGAPSTNG